MATVPTPHSPRCTLYLQAAARLEKAEKCSNISEHRLGLVAGALDLEALRQSEDSVVRPPRDDDDVFEPGFELDTEEHKEWLEKWRDEEDE